MRIEAARNIVGKTPVEPPPPIEPELLIVNWGEPGPTVIEGQAFVEEPFTIRNPSARPVSINNLRVELSGASMAKVSARVRDDTITIPAGESVPNLLTIEANEPMLDGDLAVATLLGSEEVV